MPAEQARHRAGFVLSGPMKLRNLPPRLGSRPSGRLTPQATGRIRGSALQTIRSRIFARACGLCECDQCKGSEAPRLAEVVDHIVPLWMGGQESDHNRQALAKVCHERKTASEAGQRRSG